MEGINAGIRGWGWALLLSGCAGISPESRMDEVGVPGNWAAGRGAAGGEIDSRWVGRLGGAGLSRLVDEALGANPDLEAAAARVDRAAAEARIAGAGRLPSLGLGVEGRRSKQNFIGFPFGGAGGGVPSVISQQFGVNLNAAWEVDVWGRAKAGQEAAIADAEARAYDYEAARVSLAGQVAKAWLAMGEANQQAVLATEAVRATGVLADAVRQRFGRGIIDDGGSAAQVRLTESEVESRRGSLAERLQERERVLRQLEILLGGYPTGSLARDAKLPRFPGAAPAGLPSGLLKRRPDVRSAERSLAAAGRRVKERKLARFPSFNLTGSAGTATESLGDVLKSDFGVWSLGGSVMQPIFEGGRLGAEVERAEATEREEIAGMQKTILDAFGEVEQALVAEVFLMRREAAAARAAELAKEAAGRAGEEFAAGTGDVLTLIDATRRELDSAARHLAVRRLRLDNRVDLHLALGGDFRAVK